MLRAEEDTKLRFGLLIWFPFPGYGSPHGGTQVLGTTSVNDALNAQPFGMMISVALLDQNGALHNPPVTSNAHANYQSVGGGHHPRHHSPAAHQSPGGNHQSPGGGGDHIQVLFRLPLQGFIRLMTTSSFP